MMPVILFLLGMTSVCVGVWIFAGPCWAIGASVVLSLVFGDVALAAWIKRRVPVKTGAEAMTGLGGTVIETAATTDEHRWRGLVRVRGETWSAYTDEEGLRRGDSIRIVSIQGLWLYVARDRSCLPSKSDD